MYLNSYTTFSSRGLLRKESNKVTFIKNWCLKSAPQPGDKKNITRNECHVGLFAQRRYIAR